MKKITLLAILLALFATGLNAQENPIAQISRTPGWCTIFHRWGFIGDSLCSGEHEYVRADGNKGYNDNYEYSWGQRIVAAIGGAEGENYSQGGETARPTSLLWERTMQTSRSLPAILRQTSTRMITVSTQRLSPEAMQE